MINNKLIRRACLAAVAGLLPLSAVAQDKGGDNWSISGWINEALIYYDDGVGSDIVQASDNGTTLGSRITIAGSTDLENTGMNAGFEVILEPLSNQTPLIFSNQSTFGDNNGADIGVLGTSGYVSGPFGKLTAGLQSMPTDNIAVLANPSLTLWSSISPVFRGNGFSIQGVGAAVGPSGAQTGNVDVSDDDDTLIGTASIDLVPASNGTVWGDFLNCYTAEALRRAGGIGIDCNGIYRNGIRYDLPTFFEPLSIAIGYANDDVYDIAAKFKTNLGRMQALLYIGYSENNGINGTATPGVTSADVNRARRAVMDDATASTLSMAVTTAEVARNTTRTARNTARDGLNMAQRAFNADSNDDNRDALRTAEDAFDAADAAFDAALNRLASDQRDLELDPLQQVFRTVEADQMATRGNNLFYDSATNFQLQAGLMDPVTGIFGTIAYQNETADLDGGSIPGELDNSDAFWIKVGVKRAFTSIGDTALTFQYGLYNDQFGGAQYADGVTGSELQRIGFSVDQYFGSRMIVYAAYENLDLDIDSAAGSNADALYGDADALDLFTLGMTFFF